MGIYRDDAPPPLFVPDLTPPAGAAVDADGHVTCLACGVKLPLSKADVVGLGYRCLACTEKAELAALTAGASDVAVNLSAGDRKALRRAGWKLIAPGVLAIVAGIAVAAFASARPAGYLIFGGIGSCMLGFWRMRAAR